MAVDDKYLHSDITHSILQSFYTVCNRLPHRLPLSVYKKALAIECTKQKLKTQTDKSINISYDEQVIGEIPIDLVVNNSVVVMTIGEGDITDLHQTVIKNQLRLTDYEVGLILNFAIEGQHKRVVYTNDIKKN